MKKTTPTPGEEVCSIPQAHVTARRSPIRIGLIGGSGLGQELGSETGSTEFPDTPFGKPSSPIRLTKWQGVEVAILQRHGVGHVYPPSFVPYRANIFAMKLLGVTHIVASGATGSLRDEIHPGQLVIADQVIDRTCRRASTFYERAAVHVELSEPFCPVMRKWLIQASKKLSGVCVHEQGTYVCMEGPAFSTKAESMMNRNLGGDLIGMTVMPEAKLAREAEIAYALISLPTDFDCWKPHDGSLGQQELLKEIIGNLKQATQASLSLIRQALSDVSLLESTPSVAHEALKLAIWSDKSAIDRSEVERLSPLWGKYFR